MAPRTSGSGRRGRASAIAIRAWRRGEIPAWPASSAGAPIEIGAHARPQLGHLFDRVSANRKRPQVEIAGRPGGAPARILALGGDQLYLDGDAAIGERGNSHVEPVAELDR